MQRPRVSKNGRRLVLPDGSPFFWLGDTAWELFHRLDREGARRYLGTRAHQGFNVIQIVALAEFDGIRTPNVFGHLPLIDQDPSKLNEPYWKHVDWVVKLAAELNLYVGLLPTWGDKINKGDWGIGPVIFDASNARECGRLVGRRYANSDNIIWINGGDRIPEGTKQIWRALAEGLKDGDDSHERLMTFHPQGSRSSSADFHDDDWLSFNMMQSGHGSSSVEHIANMTRHDYDLTPIKPVLDGEPPYENHPIDFDFTKGYYDEHRVRQAMYTSVFSGACGVTYGCHATWQMASDAFVPVNNPISHWRYSLTLPAASKIHVLKDLMLSLPFEQLLPGSAPFTLEGDGHRVAYSPTGEAIPGEGAAIWIDPATGERQTAVAAERSFVPPRSGREINDWVLQWG